MNVFQWIQFSIMLAQQILPLVKQIEEMVGAGNGANKKALAVSSAKDAAALSGASPSQIASVVEVADKAIDTTVATLNAIGTFKKSGE